MGGVRDEKNLIAIREVRFDKSLYITFRDLVEMPPLPKRTRMPDLALPTTATVGVIIYLHNTVGSCQVGVGGGRPSWTAL